jgi:hypothetical protein
MLSCHHTFIHRSNVHPLFKGVSADNSQSRGPMPHGESHVAARLTELLAGDECGQIKHSESPSKQAEGQKNKVAKQVSNNSREKVPTFHCNPSQ